MWHTADTHRGRCLRKGRLYSGHHSYSTHYPSQICLSKMRRSGDFIKHCENRSSPQAVDPKRRRHGLPSGTHHHLQVRGCPAFLQATPSVLATGCRNTTIDNGRLGNLCSQPMQTHRGSSHRGHSLRSSYQHG